jgi:putative flippase GtrA
MAATTPPPGAAPDAGIRARPAGPVATVDIVVPVHNEENVLDSSVRRLRRYLDEHFPFSAQVTIADNASTDGTWRVAAQLAAQCRGVRAVHLPEKGRGRALRAVWSTSPSPIVAYMDVDLATDLDALLPLVAPLLSGHSDLAIGSRLAHGARVVRGPKREIVSRVYNLMVRATVRNGFTDAQCGFKALRSDAARSLLPLVTDEGWFFDTELLVVAEANGMRIHEVPVDWVDDPDSRVDIMSTAIGDLRGLARVSYRLAAGRGHLSGPQPGGRPGTPTQRFAGIGGVTTVLYLVGLVTLRPFTGTLIANAVALVVAATVNFALHRRWTLPDGSGDRVARCSFAGEAVAALAAGLVLSSAGLAAVGGGSVVADLVVVVAANALVSVGRFVSFRARTYRHLQERAGA